MTRELLNRMPEKILSTIELWKTRYNDTRLDRTITKAEIRGYIKGLVDSDVLSENEYRILLCYMTL